MGYCQIRYFLIQVDSFPKSLKRACRKPVLPPFSPFWQASLYDALYNRVFFLMQSWHLHSTRGRPYASSPALSLRTRDCYVLFQAGPGIKKCPPQAQNKTKKKKKRALQGQIPIWFIWGKAAVLRGWHFKAGGLPERERQQNTWLAVSWIRTERTRAHYQIPYYIQSQNKLDKIREGAATGCQGTGSWPLVNKCP